MQNDKVYLALYCPMTEESGYVTLSVHKTVEGATKAIEDHKEATKKSEYDCIDRRIKDRKDFGILDSEQQKAEMYEQWDKWLLWDVEETELLP